MFNLNFTESKKSLKSNSKESFVSNLKRFAGSKKVFEEKELKEKLKMELMKKIEQEKRRKNWNLDSSKNKQEENSTDSYLDDCSLIESSELDENAQMEEFLR